MSLFKDYFAAALWIGRLLLVMAAVQAFLIYGFGLGVRQ
jgi:hypothetical protein